MTQESRAPSDIPVGLVDETRGRARVVRTRHGHAGDGLPELESRAGPSTPHPSSSLSERPVVPPQISTLVTISLLFDNFSGIERGKSTPQEKPRNTKQETMIPPDITFSPSARDPRVGATADAPTTARGAARDTGSQTVRGGLSVALHGHLSGRACRRVSTPQTRDQW